MMKKTIIVMAATLTLVAMGTTAQANPPANAAAEPAKQGQACNADLRAKCAEAQAAISANCPAGDACTDGECDGDKAKAKACREATAKAAMTCPYVCGGLPKAKPWKQVCVGATGAAQSGKKTCACRADEVRHVFKNVVTRTTEVSCVYAAAQGRALRADVERVKRQMSGAKDELRAELKKELDRLNDALASVERRVSAVEVKADANEARSKANEASIAANATRDKRVERSMLQMSVLGGFGLMRRGEPGFAMDAVGTVCATGLFSSRLGVGGCGSFGSLIVSGTTPVGLEAGGMLGMTVALDPAARHRLILGVGGRQFFANGAGVGYGVGPEARYLGLVTGPFTLSPVLGVQWGNVSGWSPETKKPFNLEGSATIRFGVEIGFSTGVF